MQRGARLAADCGEEFVLQPRRVLRPRPDRILDIVEIRVQGVRQRPLEADANRQDAQERTNGGGAARDLDFAAHHLAAGRSAVRNNEIVGLLHLPLYLLGPCLADNEPLVDEDGVTGGRQTGFDFARERLIRFDVPLVAEEDACGSRFTGGIDSRHGPPGFSRNLREPITIPRARESRPARGT